MRRFTLSALLGIAVVGIALSNPLQASAQAPMPVFMPSPAAYAPLQPTIVYVPVPVAACNPAPVCAPVRHRVERRHEHVVVRHVHDRRCR